MKMYDFQIKFHLHFSLRSHKQNFIIGSDNDMAPTKRQAIIWTNDG